MSITLGGRVIDTSGNGVNAAIVAAYPVGSAVADATTTSGTHPTTGEAGWWEITGLADTKVYRVKVTSGTQSKEFYGLSEVQFNRLTIGKDKFLVDEDGNVTIAGTLAVTGAVTHASVVPLETVTGETNVTANKTGAGVALGWTGTLAATKGGTGLSTLVRGDILYSATADTLTTLSGNLSTTRKWLSQTGIGTSSAPPLWDTIADADIPNTLVRTDRAVNTSTGLTGGGDLSTNRTLSVVTNSTVQKVIVRKSSGADIGSRQRLNFLAGTGVAWTIADVNADDEITLRADVDSSNFVTTARTITSGTGLTGGGDLSTNRTLSVVANTTNQKIEVMKAASSVGVRKSVNFIEGSYSTINISDDAPNDRINITISGVDPGATGYGLVQEEGSNLTARNTLNFIGSAITAADDSVTPCTKVTLSQSPTNSASVVGIGRTISTTTPLAGGGDLSNDRTLSIGGLAAFGTANQLLGMHNGTTAFEYKTLSGIANRITVTHSTGGISLDCGSKVPTTDTTLTANSPLETTSGGSLGANTVYGIKGLSSTGSSNQLVASAGASGWQYVNANTLDVDKVDGVHAASFALGATTVTTTSPLSGSGTLGSALTIALGGLTTVGVSGQLVKSTGAGWAYQDQGTGNGLNADYVDGIHAAAFPQKAVANIFTENQTIQRSTGNSAISIGRTANSDVPSVDFHSSGSPTTYDGQIVCTGGSALDGKGTINHLCTLLQHNGNTIWTSANDGSGSGCDSDMVDGIHLAGLVQTSRTLNTTQPLTGGASLTGDVTLGLGGLTTYGTNNQMIRSTGSGWAYVAQGSGGGIDCDTLDTLHAASFALAATTISTTSPLLGGGTLGTNRTFSISGLTDVGTNGALVKSTGSGWTYVNAGLGSGVSNGIDVQYLGGKQFSEIRVPTGSVTAFAGTVLPTDWLWCDGSAVSRTTYSSLYSVIGTLYGSGDGANTFNLPDCRERIIGGKGGSGWASGLNAKGGEATHALTTAELAAHSHTVDAVTIGAITSGAGTSHTHGNTGATSHTHTTQANGTGATGNQNVDHTHSGTTSGESNDHIHWTDSQGNHTHAGVDGTYNLFMRLSQGPGNLDTFTGGDYTAGEPQLNRGSACNTTGSHGHNISGRSADHTHNITTGGQSSLHTHTGPSHTHTVDAEAAHVHSTSAEAAHTHSTTIPSHTHTTQNAGSGTAHNTLPPYIILNYIIKV
jgi:microcystin-dependent protein